MNEPFTAEGVITCPCDNMGLGFAQVGDIFVALFTKAFRVRTGSPENPRLEEAQFNVTRVPQSGREVVLEAKFVPASGILHDHWLATWWFIPGLCNPMVVVEDEQPVS